MINSIKKVATEFEIVEFDEKKLFSIKKDEEKISLYDSNLVENVIDRKFNDTYKRLLYIVMDINNSEDSEESDAYIVRDQIDELRNSLINKYEKYLSRDILNKYLKMLLILESKIVVPEKHRGR